MEGSGENRHFLENPDYSLPVQNSFSSSFSLFNSPVPFRHILTSSGKKQNNLKENGGKCSNIITERPHTPHTYTLSYLDNMDVLQGWEHSTSASLGKDAKCPGKTLKPSELKAVSSVKYKLSFSILCLSPVLLQVLCYESIADAFSIISFCVTICRYFSRMGGSCS